MAKKRYYVSRKVILSSLLGFLFLLAFAMAETEHYYKFKLVYDNNDISLKSLEVIPTDKEIEMLGGDYTVELLSFSDEELDLVFFDFPLIIFYDNVNDETKDVNGGGAVILNQTELDVYVKYFDNAKKINIYDSDFNKVLTIDVSKYSSKSQSFEEKEIIHKEESLQKNERNGVKEFLKGKEFEQYNDLIIALIVFVIVLIVISVFIFLIRRKK